jgi:hypothetical protein
MQMTPRRSSRLTRDSHGDDGAQHHADGLGGEHQPPGLAADGFVGDDGTEHGQSGRVGEVEQGESEHNRPKPGAGGELSPTFHEIAQGTALLLRLGRCQRQHADERVSQRGQGEARRVDGQTPAWPDCGDENAAE